MARLKLSREVAWKAPKGQCRWCQEEILSLDGTINKRRNWHPECVDQYKWESDEGTARHAVWLRDKEVCASCGLNTRDLQAEIYQQLVRERGRMGEFSCVVEEFSRKKLQERGLAAPPWGRRRWWDMDHIVPLHLGGAHVMENLQTLCFWCHKAKTRQEAKKRTRRPKC